MSTNTINVDELSETINQELDNYNRDVVDGIKKQAKESMDKLVKVTKETAPKRRPRYYKHITSKQTKNDRFGTEYTWYVKGNEYRLSHLLENGHATRNGGRVQGTHFIKKASDPILEEYEKTVEDILKDG